MSTNCCVKSVPQSDSSFKVFPQALAVWQERLTAGLHRSLQASDQTMGHLEEEIQRQSREPQRAVLEEAAQQKADQTPPVCPVCGRRLSRVSHGHERSYQTRLNLKDLPSKSFSVRNANTRTCLTQQNAVNAAQPFCQGRELGNASAHSSAR